MGWRTDFKNALIGALKGIADVDAVLETYTLEPTEPTTLTVVLGVEEYEEQVGVNLIRLPFGIMGKIQEIENTDAQIDDLVNKIIEKIEGITGYAIILDNTDPHSKVEGGGTNFDVIGHVLVEKDFATISE